MGHVRFKTNGHLGSRYLNTYYIYIYSIDTDTCTKKNAITHICIYTIYIYIYVYICNIFNIHVCICSQPQGFCDLDMPGWWTTSRLGSGSVQQSVTWRRGKRRVNAWRWSNQWLGLRENLNRKPWFFPTNHGFFLQIFSQTNPMVKRCYLYVRFLMGLWDSLEFNGISTGFFIRFLRISWNLETPMSWLNFCGKSHSPWHSWGEPVCQLKLMVNGHLPANMAGWYPSRNWGLTWWSWFPIGWPNFWKNRECDVIFLGGRQVTVNSLSQWLGACNTQQRTASTGGFMLCLPVLKACWVLFHPS